MTIATVITMVTDAVKSVWNGLFWTSDFPIGAMLAGTAMLALAVSVIGYFVKHRG